MDDLISARSSFLWSRVDRQAGPVLAALRAAPLRWSGAARAAHYVSCCRRIRSAIGRRGVNGGGDPAGAHPSRTTICGDGVAWRTRSRTSLLAASVSSGWLSRQVASPSSVARSSTALSASPARSLDTHIALGNQPRR